jgi:dTMP kinase
MAGRRFQGLRTLFSKKDFRKLCVAQVFGGMGEWLATLALIGLVWDRTHSAFASGMVLSLRILPAALIGSFLGTFVDRFDRRKVLIACTAGRALIYGTLPLVGGVAPVLAMALIAEVATLAYMSARDATLPRMVPNESLSTANAVSMVSSFGSMPLGSAVYAVLVWVGGRSGYHGQALALLTAAAMLWSASILISRIASAAGIAVTPLGAVEEAKPAKRGAIRDAVRADPILKKVMVGGAIVACCGGSLLTLGLAYVQDTLHASTSAYGGLLTAFCAGGVVGVVALQKARKHLDRIFHLGGAVMGIILLGMAIFPSTIVGFGMSFCFGIAVTATMLGGITILQERVHDAVRGRVFALAHSSLRVGAVIVGLLAALGAKILGSGHVIGTMDGTQVVLGGAGLVLFATGAWLVARRIPAPVPVAA